MAIQTINIGNYNDDGTGDTLRIGGQKINDNFAELDNRTKTAISGVIAGDGISVSYAPSTGKVTIINTRVYQPSFGLLTVNGQTTVEANSPTAVLNFNAGENINITTNATTDSVNISAIWPEAFEGPTTGLHTGNVTGDVTGNVTGDLYGDLWLVNGTSKVIQNSTTVSNVRFYGKLIGDVEGTLYGDVVGDVIGDVTGNVTGNAGTVTNGVYTTSTNAVTNAMLAGNITNSKLANSSITINGTEVALGQTITIPQYVLPTASPSVLGGVKIGPTLAMNVGTGILDTIQDIRTSANPIFASLTTAGTITVNGSPTVNKHAANKEYVDNSITSAIAAIPPLPSATQESLGGVIVGEGLEIDNNGILSTVQDISITSSPLFENITVSEHIALNTPPVLGTHATTKQYVDELYNTFPYYMLPTASADITGGIRIGSSLTIDEEEICTTIQDIRPTASPTFANVVVSNAPTQNTHAANKAYVDEQGGLPIGGIIMWSGVSVPNRWALCDGTNGTPDLRNKFIIGASDIYTLNSNNNLTSATTSASGAHSHDITVGGTSLTSSQLPQHRHTFNDVWLIADDVGGTVNLDGSTGRPARDANGNPVDNFAMVGSTYGQYPLIRPYNDTNLDGGTNDNGIYTVANKTDTSGSGQSHTHTATSASAANHTHTVSTIPPYYALAFIMKIS